MKLLFVLVLSASLVVACLTPGANAEDEAKGNESESKVVYDPEDDPANDPEPAVKEPSPEELAEQREKELVRWRLVVQEIITSITAGPMGEKFSPDYLGKRKASVAMNNQLARARGQMISTMIETIGVRAETCFDRRFSDDVLFNMESELEEKQFKVDWNPQADRTIHDSRRCYATRESMVVSVPPAKPELPEKGDKK